MKKDRIALGKGYVDRYTICEFKNWFSVYVHNWHTVAQDRYHTHAFNAWVYMICGQYEEQVMDANAPLGSMFSRETIRAGSLRYVPRAHCHRILRAIAPCWTIAFAGPWIDHWYELRWDLLGWRKLGHGRRVLDRGAGLPPVL